MMEGKRWLCVFIILVSVAAAMVVDRSPTVTPRSDHVPGGALRRSKRSPFIMAFQVTRPPGMFQMSLRRPYIFSVMGNLTNMFMNSNLTTFLRRGFIGTPVVESTSTSSTETPLSIAVIDLKRRNDEAVQSRQEDLLIYD